MPDKTTERIDALETRVAYQDQTIETLNQTITAQWKEIDAFKRELAKLSERVAMAEMEKFEDNKPPPHY